MTQINSKLTVGSFMRCGVLCALMPFSLFAADDWPDPSVRAAGLPRFEHVGIVLDYATLKYNPCNDVIYPTVVKTDTLSKPLGKFYMYYAPHNGPGGICLAYADKLEGPWKEYDANPVISNVWAPHYKVDHVSGPHAIWIEEEKKLFVYYHGPNDVTRYASTTDGVHFSYEGVSVTAKMFDKIGEASYARIHRYTIPGKENRYIMLLMGNNGGTRKIYLAWSKDGRTWETRRTPLLEPQAKTGQLAGAWYLPWNGKHYLIYHDYGTYTDLHVSEVDATFEHIKYLGMFYPHQAAGPKNVAQMSECFIEEDGKLYMFTNVGPRLNQKIALAVASLKSKPETGRGNEWFSSWPEGKSPKEVGRRLAEEFLARDLPHNRHVLYPEVIAWNGSLMLTRLTGDAELNEKLTREFDYLLTPEGAKHLNKGTPDVDLRIFGSLAMEIYLQTHDDRYLKMGKYYADAQWKNPTPDGITKEARYWVDDMYMIGMLQAQAFRATGDRVYLDRCGLAMKAYLEKLQQPNGLFFHAADSPFHWGRGNGWFAAGMTEILRVLPADHPNRPAIMAGYQKMMKGLLSYQSPNGLWRQLVDKPDAWEETSGSGMFTYAMVTGVKEGWLDGATYGPAARKAWLALTDRINDKNQVRDVCVGTYAAFSQVGGDMEKQYTYYLKRPRVVGDLHGQAPMLWTACALLR